jgi:hypothetical protein
MSKNKRPSKDYSPKNKPVVSDPPENSEVMTPVWQFHRCDKDHENWGWNKIGCDELKSLLKSLASLEGLTWAQIRAQSGGRDHGTNSHFLRWEQFSKDAQDQLKELKLEEYQDQLFSLRIENTLRLYGIREGRVLKFVFHDPHHERGNPNAAYRWGS